jgi:hypothetical protein
MKLKRWKKTYIVIGSVVLLLLVARLMLPYFVTRSVNKVLSEIPEYNGSIEGVDIHLYRGAYVIKELNLFWIEGSRKIPFIEIPIADLSIEWPAIFKGKLVGEIILNKPAINFIGGDQENTEGKTTNQTGVDVDWTIPLKRLMPLQINRFEIINGSILFYDFTTEPKVNLHLRQCDLLATNISNAYKQSVLLPSKINATAVSIGDGQLTIVADINILKEVPDLDMELKFEKVNLPALNDFFQAYSKIDVEKGTFYLYSELKIDSGQLTGYAKPIIQDMQIVNWKTDKQAPLNLIWQSFVGLSVEVFSNQKKDQFALKVPLHGDLNNVKSKVWPSIISIFKNAFIEALDKNTDNSIEFVADEVLETNKE